MVVHNQKVKRYQTRNQLDSAQELAFLTTAKRRVPQLFHALSTGSNTQNEHAKLMGYIMGYLSIISGHRSVVLTNMLVEHVFAADSWRDGRRFQILVDEHKTVKSFGQASLLLNAREFHWVKHVAKGKFVTYIIERRRKDRPDTCKMSILYMKKKGVINLVTEERRSLSDACESDTGIEVTFDWSTLVMVSISSSYYGNVAGLCGNYNGNKEDELTAAGGTTAVNVTEWAGTWSIADGDPFCYRYCEDVCPQCSEEDRIRCVVKEKGCGCNHDGHYYLPGQVFWAASQCEERFVCDAATQKINLENYSRGNKRVSYAKVVTVKVCGNTYTFSLDYLHRVLVDRLENSLPFTSNNSLVQIYRRYRLAVLDTQFLKVSFDFASAVRVALSTSYLSVTCGWLTWQAVPMSTEELVPENRGLIAEGLCPLDYFWKPWELQHPSSGILDQL
ncbi:hypothetical protein L3Q82_002538 [Scortum barcoo]|uniref:Uncharacterized protein n=1 Tax=Scortum barcoo TaxID=214431 RepID=A0ACB8VYH7_9TELE|nr:hypothetical protein L3Q82_002538 [Scortum barcoo]